MILVIDDDDAVTASLSLLLKQAGHRSACAADPAEALARLEAGGIDLILQDMNFTRKTTGEEGLALLARIRERNPELPVILMTAWGSIELAVAGLKSGARDFITKPWTNEQILHAVETALGLHRAASPKAGERPPTRADLEARYDLTGVIGESPPLLDALSLLGKVAATDASVLITGESGTGKEVIAAFVHRNSARRDCAFVPVNLGGIPPTLFDSEMFGHVKGAFTDAHQDREGRFARAKGGTILLDEIGELDPSCQVKMLRVLQDRAYSVLGANGTEVMDARVVSATNRDLEHDIRSGRFREDLYYRLNLITIHLPRLAERTEDVPPLVHHFVMESAQTYGKPELSASDEAARWLASQPWPGNVRQLRHVIERTVLVTDGPVLDVDDFRRTLDASTGTGSVDTNALPDVGRMTIDELEKAMILKTIAHHDGNMSRVADSLGLSRGALYRRLEKYGIRV